MGIAGGGFGPFGKPRVEHVARYIFSRHHAGGAPIALEGIGVGEVLANLGIVLPAAQRAGENVDTAIGVACQCQRETAIGGRNAVAPVFQHAKRAGLVTCANQRQRVAERSARAGIAERNGVLETGRCRRETTRIEIGCAEHGAVAGIARFLRHGSFCTGDRGLRFACGNSRAGVAGRDVGALAACGGTTGKGHGGERARHGQAGKALLADHWYSPSGGASVGIHLFAKWAAMESISGMSPSSRSSASVTNCWALRPFTVLARRSFR